MKLLHQLIKAVPDLPVKEVIVGVFSTLVRTQVNCGIASTIKDGGSFRYIKQHGVLTDQSLQRLAEFSLSENLLEASIGMAAINCAFALQNNKYRNINARDVILEKGKGKTVGVIGHFPFLEKIRNNFEKLYIFEKNPEEGDMREKDIPEYLPAVDVVAITGTAITNHTFEEILKWTSKKCHKIVLGPSTPLSPILFDYGIDCIAGMVIQDYPQIKKQVIQGAPGRFLKGAEFVALFREDYI